VRYAKRETRPRLRPGTANAKGVPTSTGNQNLTEQRKIEDCRTGKLRLRRKKARLQKLPEGKQHKEGKASVLGKSGPTFLVRRNPDGAANGKMMRGRNPCERGIAGGTKRKQINIVPLGGSSEPNFETKSRETPKARRPDKTAHLAAGGSRCELNPVKRKEETGEGRIPGKNAEGRNRRKR